MIITVTGLFILLDIISGLIVAISNHELSSKIAREGLIHKTSYVICISLGYLIDYAQVYFDLGFDVAVGGAVCCYVCLIEIMSILENAIKINPELCGSEILSIFGNRKDSE